MARRSLQHYARRHDFDYPKFGKVVKKRSSNRVYRKAARQEDSAGVLHRLLNTPRHSRRRKRIRRKLVKGNY
jgi:hypothetical protein